MYEIYEKLQTSAKLSHVLHWHSWQDFGPKHEPARIYSAMASRYVVTPELYSGEEPFDEWLDHFDSVAKLNGWSDEDAAQWLAVRLVGHTKTAYRRLPDETRRSYDRVKAALLRRFELESKRNLYAAEFRARCKLLSEDWATFADDLKNLADKALLDLDDTSGERLAVDCFLTQITNP